MSKSKTTERKSLCDVILTKIGDKKIEVIKAVREFTGLGLKDAKDLVEGAPKAVATGLSKAQAAKIEKALTKTGATVEIRPSSGRLSRETAPVDEPDTVSEPAAEADPELSVAELMDRYTVFRSAYRLLPNPEDSTGDALMGIYLGLQDEILAAEPRSVADCACILRVAGKLTEEVSGPAITEAIGRVERFLAEYEQA